MSGRPRTRASMGVALGLAALVVALVALAFLRDGGGRETARRERSAIEAPRARPELELRAAEALPAAETEVPRGGARASGAAGARSAVRDGAARPAPPRAPVRGRLVVAETLDPIEGVFGLRLRTADLALGESLVTRADGSFASATPFPRAVVLALVEDAEGRELVDQEAPFDPEAEEEWIVRVPEARWPTFVRATIVDLGGEPVPAARVQLVPLDADRSYAEAASGADGRAEVGGLRAGAYRLHVQGRWSRTEPATVVLRSGPNDLGLLVVPDAPGAGDVRVLFRTEDDDWPLANVVLRDRARRRALTASTIVADDLDDGRYELLLERIPAGEHELRVDGLDGRVYRPERSVLRPPATVEVTAGRAEEPFSLRVRDARTRDPVPNWSVWSRAGGAWSMRGNRWGHDPGLDAELGRGVDRWIVLAGGYRPAVGRRAPDEGGVREVLLEPGRGSLVFCYDVEGDSFGEAGFGARRDALAGVEVLVGEDVVGTSDADGVCVLALEGEAEQLGYRLPGWRVVRVQGSLGFAYQVWLAQSP